ncbi:MAG: ABC transporter ATP-binding protein [Candidatus Firestonebacteria bacterium RIFOXYA2_FULL_40_8]|nr:MAG: ABC transporter ATP-binding protein [Candidatus Firestonebacteria bacterium RIFOXYA2_FULL_40_8]
MIKISNVTKYFGAQKVMHGLSLDIPDKKTVVIIGRSGCGKSVLLKHMIGLLKPDSGKILVKGKDIAKLDDKELDEARKHFGMLFQGAALFDSLTVAENVGFALTRFTKKSPAEIRKLVKEKLALVGLENVEDKKPAELSGGMKKRVGLARAIAMDPEIMLYDEPTTGLDPIMSDIINELIVELQKKLKMTSVVVTHDMKSAYQIGDKIAMMYEGKIIEEGTPKEIQHTKNAVVKQFIKGSAKGPIQVLG